VPTVYIGGGTPSILNGEQLSGLLDFLKKALPPAGAEGRELSIEANSESLSADFLQAARQGLGDGGGCDCVEGGVEGGGVGFVEDGFVEGGGKSVTRLSVGVQTLDDDCRRVIGRLGSSKHITENLSLLNGALNGAGGFELSFDLISGLPGQGKHTLRDTITKLLEYNPVHISLYDLTLEPGTLLEKMYRAKIFNFGEGQNAELWLYGRDMLEQAGFNWYEVSNFAKPGKESRHNLRYWTMKNWLGAGCGASGTLIDDETGTALRRTVTRDIESYISNCNAGNVAACFETEHISRKDLLTETLMMGFRLASGPFPEVPDEALFKKRFSISLEEAIPNTISKWQNLGLYRRDKNALTDQGRLFLNSFLLDALGEAAPGA